MDADFLLIHARELLTSAGPAPVSGTCQAKLLTIADGALAAKDGRIVYVGDTTSVMSNVTPLPHAEIYNLHRADDVVPGFVDAHTHAAYAGDRRDELRRRLAGESYAHIAASGGGIVATVAATRAASEADLVSATRERLDAMLACGTTTCEIKSGYGLTTESELRMLRAVKELAASHPMSMVATFLGAHEVPLEYRGARRRYVDLVVHEMIPAVAAAGLAQWCDVFCEDGVFTAEESERVLRAGLDSGLKPRIHADELGSTGGARVAAAVGARSADHLIFVSPPDIQALASASVTATLLPSAAFYLKLGRFAPARDLMAAGVPIALGTDVNPGGGLSPSMPFAMALACFAMGLTFEEALTSATLNAAWSLDVADDSGSLEPGKLADAVVVRGSSINLLRVGPPEIRAVVKRSAIVHGSIGRTLQDRGHA